MQKFFLRHQPEPTNPGQGLPEKEENGPYQPSRRHFPAQASHRQPQRIAGPQVAAANCKVQKQPGPAHPQQEKQVTEPGKPGPKGAQKAIEDSKPHPQQASGPKPLQGQRRWRHPNNRLNQPPCRGSS